MSETVCGICETQPSKYKCPKCVIRYCSVACFKKHKEVPCDKVVEDQKDAKEEVDKVVPSNQEEEQQQSVVEEEKVLAAEQLKLLAEDLSVKNALKDERLQKLITHIDSSPNRLQELNNAMQNPDFAAFIKQMLASIHYEP